MPTKSQPKTLDIRAVLEYDRRALGWRPGVRENDEKAKDRCGLGYPTG